MTVAAVAGRLPRERRWRHLALAVPCVIAAVLAVHDATQVAAWLGDPRGASVDVGVYHRAAQRLAGGTPLYSDPPPCCFSYAAMDGRYTYPPLLAVLLRPLSGVDVDTVARLWLALSLLSSAAAAGIAALMLRAQVSALTGAWLAVAVLSAQPLQAALYGGQVDPEILLLMTVAAWAVVRGRPGWVAGAAIGAGSAIKVSPALVAPALLKLSGRERRLALLAGAGVGAAAVALMLAMTSETFDYVARILPSFSSGVVAPWNRSLPGVALRLVDAAGAHPGRWLAVLFTVLAAAGLAGAWWLCRGARTPRGRALSLAGLLAAGPIVQGVTWDHHLVTSLLVVGLVAPSLARSRAALALVVAGLVLVSVNQQSLDGRLIDAGLIPPHGAGAFVLFGLEASINLAGMACLLLAVALCARLERGPTSRTRSSGSRAAR